MTKRKLFIITAPVFILMILFFIYWFYFSKPTGFLSDEQLVKQINETLPQAEVDRIQDTIQLDREHVFVPFISKSEKYGVSYWEWGNRKWKPIRIDTNGEPLMWKIDAEKPSTFHILWNFNPKDGLSSLKYYIIRNRNYQISGGNHKYTPRVQIEQEIPIGEDSFGVFALPDDWQSFYKDTAKLAIPNRQGLNLFNHMDLNHLIYFGWTSYNESDEETFPKNSLDGHGHGFSSGATTDFVRWIHESDLEK
ncbi:hypothetical protein FPQ10_01255 [Allobacillus sp. SKP2-8]|uniref:hypothetical protein n=1 Tax=unclassified Allobacillus TaxID=2628859 RepID=UPI0011830CAA|nr:hypothetical protein [Allobacillus sp. SKP2-8]TSJ69103.1 hypothetical protein FPQ10_01255 [Allobacillus sp. SKP2-8]